MEFHKKILGDILTKKKCLNLLGREAPISMRSLCLYLSNTLSSFYLLYENGAFALLIAEGIWAD